MKVTQIKDDGTEEVIVVKTNIGRDLKEIAIRIGLFLAGAVCAVIVAFT